MNELQDVLPVRKQGKILKTSTRFSRVGVHSHPGYPWPKTSMTSLRALEYPFVVIIFRAHIDEKVSFKVLLKIDDTIIYSYKSTGVLSRMLVSY